jgi:hypothetical protein
VTWPAPPSRTAPAWPPPLEATVGAEPPSVELVREWIGVSEADLGPALLEMIWGAEIENQADYNDVDPYTRQLALALLRRCARAAAAAGLPLGTLPVQMTGFPDAYGAMIIPRLDAEVERYEGPTRKIAIA